MMKAVLDAVEEQRRELLGVVDSWDDDLKASVEAAFAKITAVVVQQDREAVPDDVGHLLVELEDLIQSTGFDYGFIHEGLTCKIQCFKSGLRFAQLPHGGPKLYGPPNGSLSLQHFIANMPEHARLHVIADMYGLLQRLKVLERNRLSSSNGSPDEEEKCI
jgi:hypothetical protein